eukprot:TRINITY_DN2880_c0_g1_i1.p1 TRINITY_DN2880_c0_g1~~TRINITY_DN2880_c0_g1_i1.p1  ORF type:complete len:329 (-),score=83.95 TRINITY_DN2880_c0_g1_i1:52-1038(-)
MKLGVCYNVFDGEELLERSIESIKSNVDYIVVVYQKISNFGEKCNPNLEDFLQDLVQKKLVNELGSYKPEILPISEKKKLLSKNADKNLTGGNIESIGDQFFNELKKREIGRQKCLSFGCSHFLSMDTDEFYLEEELRRVKEIIVERNYDATACRMRLFVKKPIWEYFPYDNINAVPLIYKLSNSEFQLAAPFKIEVDPTRRIEPIHNFFMFDRGVIEMYHYTLVRMNMRKKVDNVSNKANYQASSFMEKFEDWKPEQGVIHPHPLIGSQFTHILTVPNYFKIDFSTICIVCYKSTTKRCLRCKSVSYCSKNCQSKHWEKHKKDCKTN